jgi:hypothetical protein
MAVMAAGAVGGLFRRANGRGRTSIVGRHVRLVEVRKGTINNARFPHASHRFNPLFRDRSGLLSGFRLRGKQHIQSNKRQRQHLPRGRGTCRMRRLSFDF